MKGPQRLNGDCKKCPGPGTFAVTNVSRWMVKVA